MTDADLTRFAEEIFPEMTRFIKGEPTLEKIEAAFFAAMDRRQKVAAIYLNDEESRETVNRRMFASAYAEVQAADAYSKAHRAAMAA